MTRLLIAAICGALLQGITLAAAQVYPSKPVTIVVPFAAGGPADTLARIVAKVKKMEVMGKLQEAHLISAPVNGGEIGAEEFTRIQNAQDAQKLLTERVPDMVRSLIMAQIVDDEGRVNKQATPTRKNDRSGNIWCAWNVLVTFDNKRYYQEVSPRLAAILAALGDGKAYEPFERHIASAIDGLCRS